MVRTGAGSVRGNRSNPRYRLCFSSFDRPVSYRLSIVWCFSPPVIGETLPFVTAFIDAVDTALQEHYPGQYVYVRVREHAAQQTQRLR